MSDVEVETGSGVLTLTLNRPRKKNALTLEIYRQLADALSHANDDPGVRVALLTAVGDTFCSGNDIMDFVSVGSLDIASAPPTQFIRALIGFEKPIVAAVQGAAIGIGATMLLHVDLVYASPDAKLSMPFVSLGLVPEAASSLLLPARVGMGVASEMLLLGSVIDAADAKELGLVNKVVPSEALSALAREKAQELAAKPPAALRRTRRLLRGDRDALLMRVNEEGRQFSESLAMPEAREALAAFIERRAPDFSKC
jgi:enoyl-CoA hydratase/carnithine racemase